MEKVDVHCTARKGAAFREHVLVISQPQGIELVSSQNAALSVQCSVWIHRIRTERRRTRVAVREVVRSCIYRISAKGLFIPCLAHVSAVALLTSFETAKNAESARSDDHPYAGCNPARAATGRRQKEFSNNEKWR